MSSDSKPGRDGEGAIDTSPQAAGQYLVIVAREEVALCRYLKRQFSGDAKVRVFTDRRADRQGLLPARERERGQHERRGQRDVTRELRRRWVVIVRSQEAASSLRAPHATSPEGRERSTGLMEGTEDRQRVDRWIEESQHMLGRMIPGLFDHRERLQGRLEEAEQECERLRREINELQKQVGDIQSEARYFRSEYAAMAEALGTALEQMGQLQKPLHAVYQRLQLVQPVVPPNLTD